MNLNHLYFKIHPKIRTYLIKPILGKNTDYYAVLPTMKEFSMDFMEYMSKPNSLKSFFNRKLDNFLRFDNEIGVLLIESQRL